MNNETKFPNLPSELDYPGVFKVECVPEKRAYFGEAPLRLLLDLGEVAYKLQDGICENQQLLQDFKKYGNDSFYYSVVVSGVEYFDKEKRKAALEAAKKAWEGELY